MLRMTQRRAYSAEDLSAQFATLRDTIASRYAAVLTPAVTTQVKALGLEMPPADGRSTVDERLPYSLRRNLPEAAEVYAADDALVVLTHREFERNNRLMIVQEGEPERRLPVKSTIEVYAIGPDAEPEVLTVIEKLAKDILGLEFDSWHFRSERFDELVGDDRSTVDAPTAEEIGAARVLSDKAARTLATAIKSSSGLLLSDVPKQLPPGEGRDDPEQLISALQSVGLVTAEVVVVCKKTNTQVNRLPESGLIENLDKAGVRCSCGRLLSEERCEEALAITNHGRTLLDSNRWFTIVLIQELLDLGIPANQILVEQEEGGDEMDCLAAITGDLFLFELKDKAFNLGNAYSFGAKIGIMRPDVAVIVTTEHVGGDARDHFERARVAGGRARYGEVDRSNTGPVYIEGIDNLRPTLEDLLTKVSVGDASRILADVLPLSALSPSWLLEQLVARGS